MTERDRDIEGKVLKEIQEKYDMWTDDYNLTPQEVEWLIEQAERVQELEEENKRIRQMKYHEAYEQGKFDTNMKVWYEMPKLEKQNKRYRETLEFYADKENYRKTSDSFSDTGYSESVVQQDAGKKARNLLRGDK